MGADDSDRERGRLAAVAASGLGPEPDAAMERIAGLTARLLHSDVALVTLVDDARQFFPGQHGLSEPWSDSRQTPLSQSLCKLVVAANDVVQVDDTSAVPAAGEARRVFGVGAYLGVPLRDDAGHVLGTLCAIMRGERRWSDDDRLTLTDLAFTAASELRARIAIHGAERSAARLQVLADAGAALNTTLDSEVALDRILDAVVPSVASWAVLFVPDRDGSRRQVFASHEDPARRTMLERFLADQGAALLETDRVQAVLRSGRPTIVPLASRPAVDPLVTPAMRQLGLGDAVVVPLAAAEGVLGVLAMVLDPQRGLYDPPDITMITDLGRRCASALSNARRFERERQTALELQHSLLPQLPDIAGISACAHYEPASVHAEIGGDWYDLIEVDDTTVIAVIGDVTGHNMSAAAVMGRLYGAVRSYAQEGHRPDVILRQIDRTAAHLVGNRYATCGIIRLRRHADLWRLEVANAGHLPPVLIGPDGSAELIDVEADPLVGLRGLRPERHLRTIDIEPRSTVVLYTDGLVERRSESIDDGLERLRSAAQRIDTNDVSSLCKTLVQQLVPDRDDDLAVLAIQPHDR